MSTIEERIADIRTLQFGIAFRPDQADYEALDAATNSIIADWNAAVEAMRAVITRYYRTYKAGWFCHACGGDELCRPELHTPDNCPVAAAQAAIAKMEGTDEHD